MTTNSFNFASNGSRCRGTLYAPSIVELQRVEPAPAVVICTGFGGTQDTPAIIRTAHTFASAGFYVLTFDYRSFGISDGNPRQVVHVPSQLKDIRQAIAALRQDARIDSKRIALWGSSLGGAHAVTTAATDSSINAVVAQVPFNGFPKSAPGRTSAQTRALTRRILGDGLRSWFGREPKYIPAIAPPGELGVMTGQGAMDAITAMESQTWENRVAPRSLLSMLRYKPEAAATRIAAPLLVSVAAGDEETSPESARRLANAATRSEIREYPFGHFDIYRPDNSSVVLTDQIHFVTQHAYLAGDRAEES